MDFQRSGSRKSRWIARTAIGLAVVCVVLLANMGVSRFLPSVPSVDSRSVVMDTVKRGEFIHEVRCVGRLASTKETERPARTVGRVKHIAVLPGVEVAPDTLLMELTNPELDRAILDAASKLAEAEATLVTERARFESNLLQLRVAWAKLESDHAVAKAEYAVSKELWEKNAYSEQQLKYQEITTAGLLKQRDLAREAFERYGDSREEHLAIYQEKIEQAKTDLSHAKELKDSLRVFAEVDGVLAQLPVKSGQQLEAGELLAKIVDPKALKAELRVAEVEARHIEVGQKAKVDTRHGIIIGTVTRVEPEVKEGSVTIDVQFEGGSLPAEARPDLSVTGLVEVNRLANVLFVGLPAAALADGSDTLFRVNADKGGSNATGPRNAIRIPVQYGIASANEIVIREGVDEGDRVIISDLSKYDELTELLLKY